MKLSLRTNWYGFNCLVGRYMRLDIDLRIPIKRLVTSWKLRLSGRIYPPSPPISYLIGSSSLKLILNFFKFDFSTFDAFSSIVENLELSSANRYINSSRNSFAFSFIVAGVTGSSFLTVTTVLTERADLIPFLGFCFIFTAIESLLPNVCAINLLFGESFISSGTSSSSSSESRIPTWLKNEVYFAKIGLDGLYLANIEFETWSALPKAGMSLFSSFKRGLDALTLAGLSLTMSISLIFVWTFSTAFLKNPPVGFDFLFSVSFYSSLITSFSSFGTCTFPSIVSILPLLFAV